MRKIFLIAAVFCSLTTLGKNKDKQPATVIITAGQSNTDGRVMNNSLPNYIQQNKYKHCLWCYGVPARYKQTVLKLSGPVWSILHVQVAGHTMQ